MMSCVPFVCKNPSLLGCSPLLLNLKKQTNKHEIKHLSCIKNYTRYRKKRGMIVCVVDPWAPSIDSQSIASQLFAVSLFPYLGFLYFITKSNSAPKLTLFGLYFLLSFVLLGLNHMLNGSLVFKSIKFGAAALARRSLSSHLNSKLRCSLRHIHMDDKCKSGSRGALVVLEGLDRCGKTLQSSRLVKNLDQLGYPAELFRFPDRNTVIGEMISSYLSSDYQLDDHTIHLLFSANRWEKRSLMESKLQSGITLIVDRYAYSGVAFSSAKGLNIEWCKSPDMGLLAPDLVLYLDISPEKASERGGYGGERYEQLEFQKKVAQAYQVLRDASWKIIDANLPLEDVEVQMRDTVLDCVKTCRNGKSLSQLWLK